MRFNIICESVKAFMTQETLPPIEELHFYSCVDILSFLYKNNKKTLITPFCWREHYKYGDKKNSLNPPLPAFDDIDKIIDQIYNEHKEDYNNGGLLYKSFSLVQKESKKLEFKNFFRYFTTIDDELLEKKIKDFPTSNTGGTHPPKKNPKIKFLDQHPYTGFNFQDRIDFKNKEIKIKNILAIFLLLKNYKSEGEKIYEGFKIKHDKEWLYSSHVEDKVAEWDKDIITKYHCPLRFQGNYIEETISNFKKNLQGINKDKHRGKFKGSEFPYNIKNWKKINHALPRKFIKREFVVFTNVRTDIKQGKPKDPINQAYGISLDFSDSLINNTSKSRFGKKKVKKTSTKSSRTRARRRELYETLIL